MPCEIGAAPDPDYTQLPAESVPAVAWCFTHHCRAGTDACKGARIEELERTLSDWRDRFALTEDGREFVSVPVAVYDSLLRKP